MNKYKTTALLLAAFLFVPDLAFAKKARTVYCSDNKLEKILVAPGRNTTLNFPAPPTKAVPGNQGLFGILYVEDDLIISALRPGARTNLSVYLDGRRCSFDLVTIGQGADDIVQVRDPDEQKIKVRIK
jgi:hypothetical protein